MNKVEEQCYLAGYKGKKLPPWVASHAKGLIRMYKAGITDRRSGKELQYSERYKQIMEEKELIKKSLEEKKETKD